MGCKEGGVNVHKGRTGVPVILIVGDEAVPMTVGVTKKGGEEVCTWVLKKEHMGLNEVGKMLRGINDEKREYDRAKGKRIHDFSCHLAAKSWSAVM
jgi:FixJ family two-component response regulator